MKMSIPCKASSAEIAALPLAVSVREAARLLSVSERSVWNLASNGKIKLRKIGRRTVLTIASINAFLDGADTEQNH